MSRAKGDDPLGMMAGLRANAKLIAAAPDMAEALRDARVMLGMNERERFTCAIKIAYVLAKAGL